MSSGFLHLLKTRAAGVARRLLAGLVWTAWIFSARHAQAQTVPFRHIIIDAGFSGDAKAVGDIDGDGLPDVVAGGAQLVWYRYPDWKKTVIANAAVEFTTDMQVGDVNGDGALDIIVADGPGPNNVRWFENPRGHKGNPATDPWLVHVIGGHGDWVHDLEVGDFDRDGKLDVVTRKGGTTIFFQDTPESWTRRNLSPVVPSGEGLGIGDVNGDGRLDLVAAGSWIENPPDSRNGLWINHPIAAGWPYDTTGAVVDLNKDNRPDVVFAQQHTRGKFAWYEAPANPASGTWTEHIIDMSIGSHKLGVGDFNNDGTVDLAIGLELQEVSIYFNQKGTPPVFSKQVLSTSGSHNIRVADIGNDGDLDIVGANYIGYPPVEMWENARPPDFLISVSPTSRTVTQGQTTTYAVAVQSLNVFNSAVGLAVLNLPGQVLPGTGFSPQTVAPAANSTVGSTLTIVTSNQTPTGTFSMMVQGVSGGTTHTFGISITVNGGQLQSILPNSVLNGASLTPGISPGSWASIFGQNLAAVAPPGRIWRAREIIDGVLPNSLEGVSVRIDNKPAAIYFVGPAQLNVQVPDDNALGPVTVEVTTPSGTGRTTAEMKQFAPGLFVYGSEQRRYAAAVHADGAIVGRSEFLPGAIPARPGDIIMLFGTGFGPTLPVRPAGKIVAPAPLANSFSVRIGDRPATAFYGGIVAAGLYQFNVQVPEFLDGDQSVFIDVQGVQTQSGVVLPVQQ